MSEKTFVQVITDAEMRARQGDLARIEAAEAEAAKNRDFVQLSRRTMDQMAQLVSKSPAAMKLLIVIGKRMGRNNALVASYETLAKISGMSVSGVNRAVKVLKQDRWMTTIRVGSATAYVVNSNVMWTTFGNLKLAAFNATIVTTSDENPDANDPPPKLKVFPFLDPGERVVIAGEPPDPPAQDHLDLA